MTPATRLAIGGLSAALAIAIAVIAVLAVSGGDDNGGPSAVAPGATAPATATVAVAATATATLPATNTPAPPTATTAPPPPPPPPPEPTPRSCAEIRADPVYRTDAEREFFLRNCAGGPAPAPAAPGAPAPQPPAPAPTSAGLTAAESTYISRASAVMGQYVARLAQYWDTPSYGAYADLLELSSIALNHANALNGLEPVPARFRAPHDRLRNSLLSLHDHIVYNLGFVRTLGEFLAWQASLERRADEVDAALVSYSLQTGIRIPSLGGLR